MMSILLLLLLSISQYGDACTKSRTRYTIMAAKKMCERVFKGKLLSPRTVEDIDGLCEKLDADGDDAIWIGLERDGCRWKFQNPDDTCPNTASAFRCIWEDWWLYRLNDKTRYRPRCKSEGGFEIAYYDKTRTNPGSGIRGGISNNNDPNTKLPCACCQSETCTEGQCKIDVQFGGLLDVEAVYNSYEVWICDSNNKYSTCCSNSTGVVLPIGDDIGEYVKEKCKDDCACTSYNV